MIWAITISVAVLFFVAGFFAGREHIKWESRKAIRDIAEDWQQVMDDYDAQAGKDGEGGSEPQKEWRDYFRQLRRD